MIWCIKLVWQIFGYVSRSTGYLQSVTRHCMGLAQKIQISAIKKKAARWSSGTNDQPTKPPPHQQTKQWYSWFSYILCISHFGWPYLPGFLWWKVVRCFSPGTHEDYRGSAASQSPWTRRFPWSARCPKTHVKCYHDLVVNPSQVMFPQKMTGRFIPARAQPVLPNSAIWPDIVVGQEPTFPVSKLCKLI